MEGQGILVLSLGRRVAYSASFLPPNTGRMSMK